MKFKEFITRQRVSIFIVGIATFIIAISISSVIGFTTIWGELLVNLAASSFTIVFTALIIDYLGLKEMSYRTQTAAGLAEFEISATCFRIKWRLARLFGLESRETGREHISDHQEAIDYLNDMTHEVDGYLSQHHFVNDKTPITKKEFPAYLDRLQVAQTELEQALILFEYATSFSLKERTLALRRELQVAERVLGFIDTSKPLNEANLSIIRITGQSIYDTIEDLLGHQ